MSLSSKWRVSTESHNGFHLKNAYAKAAKHGSDIFVFARWWNKSCHSIDYIISFCKKNKIKICSVVIKKIVVFLIVIDDDDDYVVVFIFFEFECIKWWMSFLYSYTLLKKNKMNEFESNEICVWIYFFFFKKI
jgi:hypothetical protein